jgi:tight adherence protein B
MTLIVLTVFLGVFVVATLLLAASGAGASQQLKTTLDRLESVTLSSRKMEPDDAAIIKREALLSAIPWFDRWLHSLNVFGRLHLLLSQADVSWTVGGLALSSLACAAVVSIVVYWRTQAVLIALLLGAGAAAIPWLLLLRKRSSRFAAFERAIPAALDLIVSALRAGHGMTAATGMVGKDMPDPIGREFRQCFDEQNFGLDVRTAMLNLAARMPIQDVRTFATAVLVQKESGGNLAEVLDKVASIIRERFRLKRQIQVHTAQGRLTGWILACLPPVLGIAIYLANPDYISLLWKRPVGLKMLYGAVTLTLIGILVIRKIVRIRV